MHAIELVNIIHVSPNSSLSSSLSWRSSLSLPFYWPYSAPGLQLHLICFAKETSNETTRLIIEATSNSNMWPLTRKRSLPFAVFAWIAARLPALAVRTAQAIRAKKICIRSNASGYLCKENLYPFERLGLSVQRKFASVWMARAMAIRAKKIRICSNCWGYPCEKICHPFERRGLSVRKNCVQR